MKKLSIMLFLLFTYMLITADVSKNLVAYYPFSGDANDKSGNLYDGIAYDTILINDKDGNPNSAYQFGINKYIKLPNNEDFNITQTLTVSAWIYLNTESSAWQSVICKGNTSSMSSPYALLIRYMKLTLLLNRNEFRSSVTVPANQWVHIAVTWNHNTIKFYLNGVLDTSQSYFSYDLNVIDDNCVIGKDAPGATEWFDGNLDEILIYNRALSETEIQTLYNGDFLLAPKNVQISTDNSNVTISWNPVYNATSYKIYSSENPNSNFIEDNSGILNQESWETTISTGKKFYRISAIRQ